MKKIVRRRGFTLPEVLVTVTVVAVLAAVVVPAVTQYMNRGNAPATETDISQIQNAVTGYSADVKAYPSHLADLVTSPGLTGWNGPYLSATIAISASNTGSVTTGVSNQTGATAFTSSGLGISFSDLLDTGDSGYLLLYVSIGTPCSAVANLAAAYPNGVVNGGSGYSTSWKCNSVTSGSTGNVVAADVLEFKLLTIGGA